jgi:hypothetical protein
MAKPLKISAEPNGSALVVWGARIKPGSIAGAVMVVALVGFLILRLAAGSSTTLYLDPDSGTVQQNSTISLAVRVNTAEQVRVVRAQINYPADRFAYVGSDAAGSSFPYGSESDDGAGNLIIQRSAAGSVSGNQTVVRIVFRAKVASGSAALAFGAGSIVFRASDNVNVLSSTAGGTYSLTGVPPPSVPSPPPAPPAASPSPPVAPPAPLPAPPPPLRSQPVRPSTMPLSTSRSTSAAPSRSSNAAKLLERLRLSQGSIQRPSTQVQQMPRQQRPTMSTNNQDNNAVDEAFDDSSDAGVPAWLVIVLSMLVIAVIGLLVKYVLKRGARRRSYIGAQTAQELNTSLLSTEASFAAAGVAGSPADTSILQQSGVPTMETVSPGPPSSSLAPSVSSANQSPIASQSGYPEAPLAQGSTEGLYGQQSPPAQPEVPVTPYADPAPSMPQPAPPGDTTSALASESAGTPPNTGIEAQGLEPPTKG